MRVDVGLTCVDKDDALGGVGGVGDNPCTTALPEVQAGIRLGQTGISLVKEIGITGMFGFQTTYHHVCLHYRPV